MRTTILLSFIITFLVSTATVAERQIDLSGEWKFALDPENRLKPDDSFNESVVLPGTTDTNRKGEAIVKKDETTHLSRLFSYKGKAWYCRQVDIPSDWNGKVYLTLERTKRTEIYVDSHFAGSSNDISTPQEFDLSEYLIPGRHTLTVMVDNSSGIPHQVYGNSHACTEDTQTNWNGIIGAIKLSDQPFTAVPPQKVNPVFKDFHIEGQHFYADGHITFLRGRHDACVWPLTGHTAMDKDSWLKYFNICRDYGLNHVRFHSWCPPEAAFEAADETGIYLQPELPFWGDFNDKDSTLMEFLHKEGVNILKCYGHHPSFRLFALGNELWGNIDKMAEFVEDFRKIAPDKVYTFGSNYYLGYKGVSPGMDFFVTCRVGGEEWGKYDTHTRGSFSFADAADGGMINHFHPGSAINFEEGCCKASIPIISHETAQFQTYPDYSEIKKYTGVLYPYNLEVFRDRLDRAGMLDQAEDFHKASGQWSLRLYKQDIETDLRTHNMAGFQLLDLQDYPGQGSAYVGILDAFLDSKGICRPEEWRCWCSPVVPLLVVDKFCFTSDEYIDAKIKIANYGGESLRGKWIKWKIGHLSDSIAIPDGEGLIEAGDLKINLADFAAPVHERLELSISSSEYHNFYDIWIYPTNVELARLKKTIIVTDSLTDEVFDKLLKGDKILLTPGKSNLTVGPLFQTDYWNYRMFKTISDNNNKAVSPGTLGILTDPTHPIFRNFPTEMHTNWQWFPVIKNSHPFILDNTPKDYHPIIQVIDNIERNHKLGLVFEFTVGNGKLLVVMSDLNKASEYPEGRQFYYSVVDYMASPDFNPSTKIDEDSLRKLMSTDVVEDRIGELNNISPY